MLGDLPVFFPFIEVESPGLRFLAVHLTAVEHKAVRVLVETVGYILSIYQKREKEKDSIVN